HVDSIILQFGLNGRLPIVGGGTKEHYGGVYPATLDGTVNASAELSDAPADNAFAQQFDAAFKDMAAKEPEMAGKVGGTDKVVAGQSGYPAYAAIEALKTAMLASNFTGRDDSQKLISAMETLNTQMGPDFPYGGIQMSASDHQGASPVYIYKVTGQQENILSTIPAAQLPPIGSCQV
ncbi:MAG: ABC transporter substrate-binding protein, partial [Chloroflexi bacterium]|nr:ABC transporter substrate-binding protein [Chloroflexota bacterium]